MKIKEVKIGRRKWLEYHFDHFPIVVKLVESESIVELLLYFNDRIVNGMVVESVEKGKEQVLDFTLDSLSMITAKVYQEWQVSNVMTWRKLREQIQQIPEDQLDNPVPVLDTDGYWIGEPNIELAEKDLYMDNNSKDCSDTKFNVEDEELVVEKGNYYLNTRV